jgi:CxxC-x17-CxxC domain-containing protein
MFDAVCASCGKPTKVPFQPRNDKPIYCSECFAARRGR